MFRKISDEQESVLKTQVPDAAAIDTFFREGRLGPAIVESLNGGCSTSLKMDDVAFAIQADPSGHPEVVVATTHLHMGYGVDQLRHFLDESGGLTEAEETFMASLRDSVA